MSLRLKLYLRSQPVRVPQLQYDPRVRQMQLAKKHMQLLESFGILLPFVAGDMNMNWRPKEKQCQGNHARWGVNIPNMDIP